MSAIEHIPEFENDVPPGENRGLLRFQEITAQGGYDVPKRFMDAMEMAIVTH